ncbi:thioesterase II family protein [Kutzneria buriramensis]|uniref:Surfactin synthase thioesterase subunit n=1 Tax=Kutzneria buriramensis TaxID=1045776 RepID=A0A3E0I5G6_9PSEU|nr:alpha/beta fold hydrolase [Kutzneria buriramensis]REH53982.1 surfactin synthase thioesterase subunit [Kutzneria buriramensis]
MSGDAWIRRFHPVSDAPTRLVCFPHAGGSATFYFPVSRALSPAIDVIAIQYPGRQDRRSESCVDSIGELADIIAAHLEPLADKPISLFGHSMGAMIAYEVARRMEKGGTAPLTLFASGRRAPSRYRDERMHLASDDGLITELKSLSGTDSAVLGDEEILRMILPSVRSDYKAVETYQHQDGPLLNCPVTVLTGDNDPMVTMDEAEAWAEHTNGPFDLKVYPGGHFFINEHAAAAMRLIRETAGVRTPLAA